MIVCFQCSNFIKFEPQGEQFEHLAAKKSWSQDTGVTEQVAKKFAGHFSSGILFFRRKRLV